MSEKFRSQLDRPNFYTEQHAAGNSLALEGARLRTKNVRPNPATQDRFEVAYDVAHIIKADIDTAVELSKQRDAVQGEGYTWREQVPAETRLTLAQADLERNAQAATEIAIAENLTAEQIAITRRHQAHSDRAETHVSPWR